MKMLKYLSVLILLLCLVIPAGAQDLSSYGLPLEIILPADIDTDALHNTYLYSQSNDDFSRWQRWDSIENGKSSMSVWSPDDKWIAFNGMSGNYLWIVSAEGGVPTCVYYDVDYETEKKVFNSTISNLCFSHNSREITFETRFFDQEKGSIVDVEETDAIQKYNFSNPQSSIETINIFTGEHRVITEGKKPNWSNDGRYLCYLNFDYRKYFEELETDHDGALTIFDTLTGEKWFLTDGTKHIYACRFIPDDSAVVFSMDTSNNKSQFFKVPVTGGEPEQLSFPISNGDGTGNCRREFDISPDGEWLLYTDLNFNILFEYSGSTGGQLYNTSSETTHLCAFHLATGETYKLFPEPQETNMYGQNPSLSLDSTKICYGLSDWNSYETRSPHIYITDFNTDNFRKIVHVEEEKNGGFVLMGNYPNPFNPATTIEFTLPEAGFAELSVYNITGQKIRELLSGEMTAGFHSALWDGRDQLGNPVSSGVFISRLRTRDNVFSNRMILVK
ncbi:FlgD immunoglobulin-like domain containing protein [Candidatus Latescibacterota bacterium]